MQFFSTQQGMIVKDQNTRDHLACMAYRERGSHARGVYPAQNTTRMERARMKQEEGSDTRFLVIIIII